MRRLFWWPLVVSVMMLIVFADIAMPIVAHHTKIYHLPVHKTLYLDRNIFDDEIPFIMEAAINWNEATNGEITYDIKRLPAQNIDIRNSIIVANVTPDNPQVMLLDNFGIDHITLAYFDDSLGLSFIGLVDNRLDKTNFTHVMMHELGHSLGIKHLETDDGITTLMYPLINDVNGDISDIDLYRLCELYNCDSSKFHGK